MGEVFRPLYSLRKCSVVRVRFFGMIGRICARQGIGTGGNTKERREGKLDPPACTLWRLGAQ
eukprot:2675221-Pyramimonas_sp.AAC.1